MSCPPKHKCGLTAVLTWVELRINQLVCSVGNYFDLCEKNWGEYGLSGCVSQAPDYSNGLSVCEQQWGSYGLAGCVSYTAVHPDAYTGETYGLTPFGA